ncbi:4727_t:CDS:2 [Ambispora gerdemannii]|uniref:Zinc finger protein 830 n=1 Tax=Ambispora gerdemannii TaxID=144530 RepID=A0A9N8UX46_9GLOM|nr:4727_t:CDS:2 [Ambispora gerdemannii]
MSTKELRRLLSSTLSQRQASASASSKITHPFAKYENNKLYCIVCSSTVKNDTLWNVHLNSTGHKEQLKKLKEVKERAKSGVGGGRTTGQTSTTKLSKETNKSFSTINQAEKKRQASSLESTKIVKRSGGRVKFAIDEEKSSTSSALPLDFFDDSEQMDYEKNDEQINPSNGFFDEPSSSAQLASLRIDSSSPQEDDTKSAQKVEPVISESSVLPDDFFDNPKKSLGSSSSLGNVEKNQSAEVDEEEWQLFQRLISKETQVSNKIADADDEELQRDRDEMQEREQEMCIKRLEKLKESANRVKQKQSEKMMIASTSTSLKEEASEDGDEMEEEDDENEWMDWRSQKILR